MQTDQTAGSSAGETSIDENEVLTDNQDNHVDPEEDGRTSPFSDLCVAWSTAALWGRRIVSVTTSDSAAFAVSELGEVGGNVGAGCSTSNWCWGFKRCRRCRYYCFHFF